MPLGLWSRGILVRFARLWGRGGFRGRGGRRDLGGRRRGGNRGNRRRGGHQGGVLREGAVEYGNENLDAGEVAVLEVHREQRTRRSVEVFDGDTLPTGDPDLGGRVRVDRHGPVDLLVDTLELHEQLDVFVGAVHHVHDEVGVLTVLGDQHRVADRQVAQVLADTVAGVVLDGRRLRGEQIASAGAQQDAGRHYDGCHGSRSHKTSTRVQRSAQVA
ncbi:hypothetical protein E3O42_04710 [Cryobacterium adonitolivorans]|uniref:Uncharacterized protein n=1 Tax=Cryobacterium adonitolivorans TaxID=1259189 RepID=A0A4R8WBV4_9MICO|nr:hypothetical protein E3O42_04710 [Cryobacterium adonitolivorans]